MSSISWLLSKIPRPLVKRRQQKELSSGPCAPKSTSPRVYGRKSLQYTLGLSLVTPDNNQRTSLSTHIGHRRHNPRQSRGTIHKEIVVLRTTQRKAHEGRTKDIGQGPRDDLNPRKGHPTSTDREIQYQGSISSLSTWWPRETSLRWSQKKSPSSKAWTQLERPIQGVTSWDVKLWTWDMIVNECVVNTWCDNTCFVICELYNNSTGVYFEKREKCLCARC